MVRLALLFALLFPMLATAQTRAVDPDELSLTVEVETMPETPLRGEMILITIHGVYKRHITREKLEQPDFEGFNWMELGEDFWYDSMLDGLKVRNMRRRMALFPEKTGNLTIGAFKHHLTLLDENNKWFEHVIASEPVEVEVKPEPAGAEWWFPVRGLTITDDWSNPPDQLSDGAGVLRIIRVSALGASPDMIPPMPELKSPSGLIFAHPEKRLVDLTSKGPQSVAFWRWTIAPGNGHATIVEPIRFSYFDTTTRQMREVEISAQRVAYGDIIPPAVSDAKPPDRGEINGGWMLAAAAFGLLAGFLPLMKGGRFSLAPLRLRITRWRIHWRLRLAASRGDISGFRRAVRRLEMVNPATMAQKKLLAELDSAIFGTGDNPPDLNGFRRRIREIPDSPEEKMT